MTSFMNADFLLKTETAKKLYHEHAEKMPIIDYHCHINPQEIYEDKRYNSITEVWLGGDHYKWRAMRSCGVAEKYITGDATPAEKFQKWGETMPNLIGNPLYHWTHLELQRYFGITEPLNGDNAMEIYEKCNAILAQPEMSARGIIKKSGVQLICTTDDPADDLHWHELLAADPTAPAVVLPAFRPDKAMRADKPTFPAYVAQLEKVVGYPINTIADMRKALVERIHYFNDRRCRVADHGLDFCFCVEATEEQLNDIFARAKNGEAITQNEQLAYHTALLMTVNKEYSRLNWVSQFHFSCLRDNSVKMFAKIGADTGYDSINDQPNAASLSKLLGKQTIRTKGQSIGKGSHGSSSDSYQVTGRELMTPDEVRRMKRSDCLVMISGEAPVRDKKYNLFDHPNLKYTPDYRSPRGLLHRFATPIPAPEGYTMPPDYMAQAGTVSLAYVAELTCPDITEDLYDELQEWEESLL